MILSRLFSFLLRGLELVLAVVSIIPFLHQFDEIELTPRLGDFGIGVPLDLETK
jgi:hypothetical protein